MTVDVHAELDKIYAELPTMDCQGKCHSSCGPIEMTQVERQRIVDAGGPLIPRVDSAELVHKVLRADGEGLTCPALGAFRQCTVYQVRPLICRMWGSTEGMPCPFGCRPSHELTDEEAFAIMSRVAELTDDWDFGETRSAYMELAHNPVMAVLMRRYQGGDDSVGDYIAAAFDRVTDG